MASNLLNEIQPEMTLNTLDLSSLGTTHNEVQGITKVQICANHTIENDAYLTKITIPQNHNRTDYTANTPLHLVLYGDTTGNDTFVFVAYSSNTQVQLAGGEDLVFLFNKENIGGYKKYRLFYATDITSIPVEPTNQNDFSNTPKMAFRASTVDTNCAVWQSDGVIVFNRTIPIIFEFETPNQLVSLSTIQMTALLDLLTHKDALISLLQNDA